VPPIRLAAVATCALALAACAPEPAEVEPPARLRSQYHLYGFEQDFGYAQAVKMGRTLHVSAAVAVDPEGRLVGAGDMAAQLAAAYANLARTLETNGFDFDHVVRETIYTTDMDALLAVSGLRFERYDRTALPAVTWVQVERLVDPGFMVAIEVTAELP
jgi:enamine deaminase RidA (YjgF/YER057c/UK114 family)